MKRRKHYLYHEEQRADGSWVYTRRELCLCHIDENHWPERPYLEEKVA